MPPTSPTDDDENDDDALALWAREETPILTLSLPSFPLKDADAESSIESEIYSRETLKLRQYPSDHNNWGIHGTVWDGGVAQLAYMHQHWLQEFATSHHDNTTEVERHKVDLIDLGSGTGVLGLGLFLLANGTNSRIENTKRISFDSIFLTDLKVAVPLLKENLELNHLQEKEGNTQCFVEELSWGEELFSSIQEVLMRKSNNQILVTGADIVYRQNLFGPLLKTMRHMADKVESMSAISFLFSSQSIRSHLKEFWDLCQDEGWNILPKAMVRVSEHPAKLPEIEERFEAYGDFLKDNPWSLVESKRAPGVVVVYEILPSFLYKK